MELPSLLSFTCVRMKPAMKRNARFGLTVIALVIALPGCHRLGGGYGERVDVPLSVSLTLTGTSHTDCQRVWCTIGFKAVVTDDGDQPAYGRDCRLRALDENGKTVLERIFGVGIGPGIYTEPGKPGLTIESLGQVTLKERTRVRSLEGTCLAYIWHGSVPI